MGLYFHQFTIGDRYTSRSRRMTEADLDTFNEFARDNHPLHSDAEFAKSSIFGQRVFHASAAIALVDGFIGEMGITRLTGLAILGVEWSAKTAIVIGDLVKLTALVEGKRLTAAGGRGVVHLQVALSNERSDIIGDGRWTMLVADRDNV
ncbi:MaoC/PaaZ C-terminal domain-containing protein [Microvirga zambiensis]|uniref:MaoC/PaaZ C-terminal domain-containing protein n=1 Tax=Microvirga zambiensis TaxID=1402137 RepID=UPI00191C94A0|nr:MaoC/PaaZ C-terminal domain-containing protein [Microvirga zambiensis]